MGRANLQGAIAKRGAHRYGLAMTRFDPAADRAPNSQTEDNAPAGERIAKFLSRSGVCSRRDAERLIGEGRVKVDGEVLPSPAFKVTGQEDIRVDDEPVRGPAAPRLWRYHKPTGLVTTHKDPEGRDTVFDNLPSQLPRVVSVGRLDLTSEGLLLLTNDGGLARRLELPKTGWARRYKVRAHGAVDEKALAGLAKGVVVDGMKYGAMQAVLERRQGANAWLVCTIREGKNREVRKVLESIGLKVNRLIRTAYGPFQLGALKKGEAEEVPAKVMREQLGKILSEAG